MSWRAFALRHLLGRLHIGEDILRHLTTFQRLGATLELAPPGEMLPVGARTALRAIRTRGAADISPDWLWPWWLQRQLDPTDDAFTPRGHLPVMQNVTHRNWTLVGNMGSAWEAIVDPTGLVTAQFDGWSLDWWVRDADGRWHFPSRSAERVRQRLMDARPVVETRLGLPDGEVVQRVYAVETVPELVVVEVHNAGARDCGLAMALRPYNPEGLAVVEDLSVHGQVVSVGKVPVLYLPRLPERSALSTFEDGDVVHVLEGRREAPPAREHVHDRAGLAQGAFTFTLPAGETLRFAAPMAGRSPRRRWPMPWRRRMRHTVPQPERLPGAAQVRDEWDRRMRRGTRVELPDARLQEAVDANRAFLLLLHDPGDITPGPMTYHRFWFRDAAYQLAALDRWGLHTEVADVLRTYPGRQRGDGFFYSQWREWDANGAAIWSLAEHERLTADAATRDHTAAAVASGVEWILRTLDDPRGKEPEAAGLLPAGISAEHLGPFDYYYWDNLWAWRGLVDGATLLHGSGRHDAAAAAARGAEALGARLRAAWDRDARRLGRRAVPAGPGRGFDAGMIGALSAVYPLGLLAPDDEWMRGTAEVVRERFLLGQAFFQGISHTGLGTYLTVQLAMVEIEAGDPRGWDRVEWLLDAATDTWTWPEAIHPRLPGGCMGDGHHGWMAADLLNVVRLTIARETADGLTLFSVLPERWRGGRVALRGAPTHHGLLDLELEWPDERPLLRWSLRRRDDRPVRLTAPALDPSWHSDEPEGEARLGGVYADARSRRRAQ
ncbi:MAG TPA: hypothetical protein VNU01_10235 [Egibacteraceae bacterium]|nr:hypothetical protein [Egibacteraceae bacterium]